MPEIVDNASIAFEWAVADVRLLLEYHDRETSQKAGCPPVKLEVFKRASVILMVAAWETFIEDAISYAVQTRMESANASKVFEGLFEKELKGLNTPDSKNIKRLSAVYTGTDITQFWKWGKVTPQDAAKLLDAIIKLRGRLAHRTRKVFAKKAMVTRAQVIETINVLSKLVACTQKAFKIRHRVSIS